MQQFQFLRKEIIKTACQGLILLIISCALVVVLPKVSEVNASDLKPTDLERIQIGKAAPDFNLETVDGNGVKLSNYKDQKNVILIFYRGWW